MVYQKNEILSSLIDQMNAAFHSYLHPTSRLFLIIWTFVLKKNIFASRNSLGSHGDLCLTIRNAYSKYSVFRLILVIVADFQQKYWKNDKIYEDTFLSQKILKFIFEMWSIAYLEVWLLKFSELGHFGVSM